MLQGLAGTDFNEAGTGLINLRLSENLPPVQTAEFIDAGAVVFNNGKGCSILRLREDFFHLPVRYGSVEVIPFLTCQNRRNMIT